MGKYSLKTVKCIDYKIAWCFITVLTEFPPKINILSLLGKPLLAVTGLTSFTFFLHNLLHYAIFDGLIRKLNLRPSKWHKNDIFEFIFTARKSVLKNNGFLLNWQKAIKTCIFSAMLSLLWIFYSKEENVI